MDGGVRLGVFDFAQDPGMPRAAAVQSRRKESAMGTGRRARPGRTSGSFQPVAHGRHPLLEPPAGRKPRPRTGGQDPEREN